jgi:predicted small secreted protein
MRYKTNPNKIKHHNHKLLKTVKQIDKVKANINNINLHYIYTHTPYHKNTPKTYFIFVYKRLLTSTQYNLLHHTQNRYKRT